MRVNPNHHAGHIQPTAMFGRVVKFQAIQNPTGFRWNPHSTVSIGLSEKAETRILPLVI
jgi:hypothetical protein